MQVTVEIEVQRDGGPAASLTMSFGTWLWARVWADAAGAAKIGGLAGASVRAGGNIVGVELLGAARLRERLGRVRSGLVRMFRENLRRLDVFDEVALELLRASGDSPLGARQRAVEYVASHVAPWATVGIAGEAVVIKVPHWLPEASVVELRRRMAANSWGVNVVVIT